MPRTQLQIIDFKSLQIVTGLSSDTSSNLAAVLTLQMELLASVFPNLILRRNGN